MLFWFGNNSNTLDMNDSFIYFMSSLSSRPSGLRVDKNNFRYSIALYIARNREVILKDFTIQDNVYLAPKEELQ